MAFLISAKWAWIALKFILRRREELKKIRKKGLVVVVSGCTSGLGMEIVCAVCDRLSKIQSHGAHTVIITTKDKEEGLLSLERLRHPTVCVGFHELDACNDMSMAAFSQNLKKKFGSIDILIDSAGVLPTTTELGCKGDTDHIMAVDYHATKIAAYALLPLMAPGGRVIIGASSLAEIAIRWMNDEAYTKLFSPTSTDKDLDEVADGFVEEFCTAGSSGRRIYDALAYPFAQATRIALAQYMGNQLKLSSPDPKMRVTVCSFSPGWCRAPSAGNRAPFSAREGANEAVYAAFDANAEEVQGSFLIGRKPAKFGDEIGAIDTDTALPQGTSTQGGNHAILKRLTERYTAALESVTHVASIADIVK